MSRQGVDNFIIGAFILCFDVAELQFVLIWDRDSVFRHGERAGEIAISRSLKEVNKVDGLES